jgi:acyl carrier protein
MITNELKSVLLTVLKLEDWEIRDETIASEIPGWDSLNHVNVIAAVEEHFGVRFKTAEVLRLKNLGDLQRLVTATASKPPAA